MSTLTEFLNTHRVEKGTKDWNITGIQKGVDVGSYKVNDDEYDLFLRLVHSHIFGRPQRASSLLEKHRDVGPPLVDLDFRYNAGGPLERQFTSNDIRKFIAEYLAAMVYFSRVEDLTVDPVFYHLHKPAPEKEAKQHKDGVHIHCPNLTTLPKYQFGIRGYLLQNNVIERLFGTQEVVNDSEDVYDYSVIKQNNWFLYGACKPDKAQYKIASIWRLPISELREALDGGDPEDFTELAEIIYDLLEEEAASKDTFELMKLLSIRRNHKAVSNLPMRPIRASEWEELMITWGSGKKKAENTFVQHEMVEEENATKQLVVTDVEEHATVTQNSSEDVMLAYRFCRECINAEKRCGDYQDWVNMAICLKNIANTEDSFKVWCEMTRAVAASHKKAHKTDAQLREKWNLIRIDESRKLGMASLNYWAREDNEGVYRSILSETHTKWIINFAKDTHVSVASFVCRFYRHEFRCSYGSRRKDEWFHFPKGAHSWRYLKNPVVIRASLSEQILAEYWEAEKKIGDEARKTQEAPQTEALDAKKKKIAKIQTCLQTTTFKDHVLKECAEKFYDEEFLSKLNTNPYLVGVANGVLELRYTDEVTKEQHVMFRPGLPEDNVSFHMGRTEPAMESIPYEIYNPSAPTQTHRHLLDFFQKIYPDAVLREYVLTLLSSCLEGNNAEQKFYVMQGVGSNGKSMIEILMEATFGDYGTSVSTATFTRKRPDAGNANADVITVKCKRYLHCGEPDDGEKINTSIMKAWSGGDLIPARGLFSDQEKFKIMGKIFMSCNDLPPVQKMDDGTWRRIRVIPHISVFKDPGNPAIDPSKHIYEKDYGMESKLRTWRVAFLGILVWYYEHKYLRGGLVEPACVSAASDKYKEENDLFQQFVSDTYIIEPDAGTVSVSDFRAHFQLWAKSLGKCDLKPKQADERMRKLMKAGAKDKEFHGLRRASDGEDLSGATIGPARAQA